ncbi:MAG: sulfotransferase family protein [Candidatus Binatia bacterium]
MAPREIWPNFFIVGAPRSGTTSLYEYLRQVPGIYMSPVKEPRYFDAVDHFAPFAPKPIRSKAKYLRLFKNVREEALVGEASPSYLMDLEAPQRIHSVAPHARIIMILRDPVEQIYSAYLQHRRSGFQRLPFPEAVKLDLYLKPAFYTEAVKRYCEVFGADRVKIVIFEEFIRDTPGAVREILRFLGVEAEPPPAVGEIHNSFGLHRWRWSRLATRNTLARNAARRFLPDRLRRRVLEKIFYQKTAKPPMPEEGRNFLEGIYRDDVAGLEKLLGRPLPWFHAKSRSAKA